MEQILDFSFQQSPKQSLATNNALLYRFWYCLWHTTSFVILMIEAIGIKEFTAQFIGIIIYGAVNFMVNNRITFR